MRMFSILVRKTISILLVIAAIGSDRAIARTPEQADTWHMFAQKVEVGTRLKIRLDDGQRITATLIEANAEGLLVQPRTRVPVPVQRIAYDRIASLERDKGHGIGAGKAVAIGVASGVGAFLGTLLILIATID
jgi:hypothetical protein